MASEVLESYRAVTGAVRRGDGKERRDEARKSGEGEEKEGSGREEYTDSGSAAATDKRNYFQYTTRASTRNSGYPVYPPRGSVDASHAGLQAEWEEAACKVEIRVAIRNGRTAQ